MRNKFSGNFSDPPQTELTPLQYFMKFIAKELLQTVAENTNFYSVQKKLKCIATNIDEIQKTNKCRDLERYH